MDGAVHTFRLSNLHIIDKQLAKRNFLKFILVQNAIVLLLIMPLITIS